MIIAYFKFIDANGFIDSLDFWRFWENNFRKENKNFIDL
jgi:hypothetical protein